MEECLENTVSPFQEMVAYETLWAMREHSPRKIAGLFRETPVLPSLLLRTQAKQSLLDDTEALARAVEGFLRSFNGFSVCVRGTAQYPSRIRDVQYPPELFYYKGDIGLLETPCLSLVGARKCTEDGARRTERLAQGLVKNGYTIISGLALGIDAVAMKTAISSGGHTIGVIGTPINQCYPAANTALQQCVARDHLLISHVPFYRYEHQPFGTKRYYFPQRNETMASLSKATIIVEASDTSGTLTQARACLRQGRRLFIVNSCFDNPSITWPKVYAEKGAVRVRGLDDILKDLESR